MKPIVYLNQNKEATVLRGHPWIFPKAISKMKGTPVTGELVAVHDSQNIYVGVGLYNEHSLYRVRMLAYAWESSETTSLADIIQYRLQQAALVRQALNLPNKNTNAFRLVNSEADGLSGLTIEYFNGICVVASSAYWVEANKAIILSALEKVFACASIIWLPQSKPLAQDGWKETNETGESLPHGVEVLEAGIKYQIDFSNAQKTGLFIDQRENHQRIGNLAAGKRVLDLYTYTGGFALHAAMGGAQQITAIDKSAQAIEQAKINAQINGFNNIEFIAADSRDYLTKAGEYDIN